MKPLLILALTVSIAHAQGPLAPAAAPAPAMKTLDQIEPRTPLGGNPTAFVNITSSGSYYLVSDVAGLGINADNVNLDLSGFTVKEVTGYDGIGIGTGFKGVSIRNGFVVGSGVWTQGSTANTSTYTGNIGVGIIAFQGSGAAPTQGISIDQVTVRGFNKGISLSASPESNGGRHRITNCILRDFGSVGIEAITTLITNTVISNGSGFGVNGIVLTTENLLIHQIDGIGMRDNGGSVHRGTVVRQVSGNGVKGQHFSLSGVNASACGGDGIQGDSLQIENCTASFNLGSGIFSPNSTIKNCMARGNGGAGISADSSVISGCGVLNSGADGIRGLNSTISLCKSASSNTNPDGYIGKSLLWTGGRQVDNVSDSYDPAAPAP